jgi:20S proteasome alpha/beta subunit
MTLIAALRCSDGLILGSDSQETRGARGHRLARSTQKVYEPRPGFLLAWAGPQDVAQGFTLRLARAKRLSPSTDRLEIKARLHAILAELREDSTIEARSDHVELLIAWWSRSEGKHVALHLFSGGAGEWVVTWAFGGMELGIESATFASSTLRYIDPTTLTLEQAKIVVLKVLRDAIDTTVEGIGGQIQLGTIQKSGVRVLNKTDVRGLHDTVNLWESQCAELLPGAVTRPPTGHTLDRGVGLPS